VRACVGDGDDELATVEAVYRERHAAFLRLATAITRDEQAARDAVHDAFVRAVRYRRRLRRRSSAAGWIAQIVLNEARKRGAEERRYVPRPSAAFDRVADVNGHRQRGAAEAALAALPERQRLALFLRYYADLDYAGIAHALDVAPGTVSATLHAARENLASALEEVEQWER
jgi:RNA polymerase sigma-70 factor (ECF subfamily)